MCNTTVYRPGSTIPCNYSLDQSDTVSDHWLNTITYHPNSKYFYLNGKQLAIKPGRRGVRVGCYFVTYEALDALVKLCEEE